MQLLSIVAASFLLGASAALASPAFAAVDSLSPVISRRANSSSEAGPYGLNNVHCQDVHLKVPVSSQNLVFKDVVDNYDNASYVNQQILDYSTGMTNYTQKHVTQQKKTVNATYDIFGQYCTPKEHAKKNSSLIVAVHGVGFDHTYWNFNYKDYSFIRHAASHGYSVFAFDRLGCGKSSKPSKGGFSVVQSPHELAILKEILRQTRQTSNVGGSKHSKITLIGHSYGSVQGQAISAQSPDLIEGLVLTGFSTNSTGTIPFFLAGTLTIANEVPDLPQLKKDPSIWLATASSQADSSQFNDPLYVEQGANKLARSSAQPVTLGTLFSISAISGPSMTYNKPVFVINGEEDLPFCNRNCDTPVEGGLTITQSVSKLFPQAKNFTAANLPNTGHGISAHPTSAQGYEEVLSYIMANGL